MFASAAREAPLGNAMSLKPARRRLLLGKLVG